MRILICPSAAHHDNLGDVAMLKTAVARLREIWPAARLQVLTDQPESLKTHCPEAEPVEFRACKSWFRVRALPGWAFPEIPAAVRSRFPLGLAGLGRLRWWLYPPDYRRARKFSGALFGADLLVLTGAGLINDEFPFVAARALNIFAVAIRSGVPSVMFGQGFGPLRNQSLVKLAAEVLPQVHAIHLREGRASLSLLRQLGVPEEKAVVTGDDAIELSFRERSAGPGACLGVNLRVANYSAIAGSTVTAVAAVIAEKARQYQTQAVGIPINIEGAGSDVQTITRLLGVPDEDPPAGPGALRALLRRIGGCRVVVAGSYHAGVFALAQGVPVVAVARSEYYRDKFAGLAHQFGAGCTVILADDPQFAARLGAVIDRAWDEAEQLRPRLLRAAELQIQASRAAYERLPVLIG